MGKIGLNNNGENNYRENQKKTIVETPNKVCEFLFKKLNLSKDTTIIDVGCSSGNLSKPFYNAGHRVVGIDVNPSPSFKGEFIQSDFFKLNQLPVEKNEKIFVLCNPPWNNPKRISNIKDMNSIKKIEVKGKIIKDSKKNIVDYLVSSGFSSEKIDLIVGEKYKHDGMNYYPEMFMRKIFDLLGDNVSVMLLTIYGFLMNNRKTSKRYAWLRDSIFKITSICEIPLNLFQHAGVQVFSHIVFFNTKNLPPVWFLSENCFVE